MVDIQDPFTFTPGPANATSAAWVKSSYSDPGGNGDCVEVCSDFVVSHDAVGVRDSKDPQGPRLRFAPTAWAAFLAAATDGEFGTA
ncbi:MULTISPECIES: DUF397 domain-containing protein [Kitasatospora]|uniref:DUF397 domain-containing protein n=1 Tax=Kitasatospora setae (strain ATCC 33774 / DSM 43861 / JCM 3304 / KCC A-0304 / NBRC 14216 / KM-6054) TaxID=452652 RepID=E4N0W9_KITSK|nr:MULTISPECIES: DUF397 domain-containing protein [Kitasatospora]BAJ31803.1 hypothetical protein KSE_60350 [Kitasatospora setae KM-6054]